MILKGAKINFLGDSITEGCGTSSKDAIFMNVLARREGLAVARNYGIGGTRIARQHIPTDPVWDRDFCMRVDSMDADADAVVVFGGTNDYGHGDAPLGCMNDRTPETFYGALHTLYRSLYERYPHAVLAVMTPTHRCAEDTRIFNERDIRLQTNLEGYVNIITEVAGYYSIPVLDLYRCSGLQPAIESNKKMYMPDGLHPNDAGHAVIAERLATFLKSL